MSLLGNALNSSFLYPTGHRAVLLSKSGKRKVVDSIPGCACRPNCSDFSLVFSETRVNMD